MKVLETAAGAVFAPTRFSLVRISIRDQVADGNSLVRNSGVGGGSKFDPQSISRFVDLSFLFCPFSSFLGLSRFFWDFPDLSGDSPRIFPIWPFPLYRPMNSTYEERSRKGPRHNLDLSRKKWETPRFGKLILLSEPGSERKVLTKET